MNIPETSEPSDSSSVSEWTSSTKLDWSCPSRSEIKRACKPFTRTTSLQRTYLKPQSHQIPLPCQSEPHLQNWTGPVHLGQRLRELVNHSPKLQVCNKHLSLVMLNIFMYMYYTPPNLYPMDLQYSRSMHVFSIIIEKCVDIDQMASLEASWTGSTVFFTKQWTWVQQKRGKE